MTYSKWMMALSLSALVSGCGVAISGDTSCDLSDPIYFGNDTVVDELVKSDPKLLRQIVEHNETRKAICNDT